MVVWWRCLQVVLFVGASYIMGQLMLFLYNTTNLLFGFVGLAIGSGILALMVVWGAKIQNNINRRSGS